MSKQLVEFLKSGRTWIYGVIVPSIVGLIIAVTTDGMGFQMFLVWTLFFLLLVAVYEGFLRQRSIQDTETYFAGSANGLYKLLPHSLADMIRNAGPDGVAIMGGALGGFAINRENTEALGSLSRQGAPVQILMLDPEGPGVERLADQRRQVGSSVTGPELRAEIRTSLKHLRDQLGPSNMYQSCRLYSHTPRNAIYRIGDSYVVTVYRFGGGGSSPSLFLTRNEANDAFCNGLDRSFRDTWNSETSRPFRDEDIL